MRALYRFQQFARTVNGPQTAPDLGRFESLLAPQQKALFASMAPVDQRHCLAVATALAEAGEQDADLLRAALVHDAGKSTTRIRVWERVAHVLLQRLAPAQAGKLGSSKASGFGHGLYVLAHHAALGAELAARAGFSDRTVALVGGGGDPHLQQALRRADDTN